MKYLLNLIFIFIIGCGTILPSKNTSTSSPSSYQSLEKKSEVYSNLVKYKTDENGFILTEACDSLLFSGLLSAAKVNMQVDIRAAQDENGNWHRRPNHDCGPEFDNSRSTISRDMMIGLMWHLWRHQDVNTATELLDDLKSNLYFMEGEGTAGELLWTPAMLSTLAHLILKLDGPRYPLELALPVSYSEEPGYVAHLIAFHIGLRGEILGGITSSELDLLKLHKEREEQNPLFQAVYHKYLDGNQDKAINLLLNSQEWPANNLPTTVEHCDAWPIQRDYSEKDWGPCNPYEEHTGAELIIIYELFIRKS